MTIEPVTNVKLIGHAHGHDMFSWNEGTRTFEDYPSTVTGASGTTYGLVLVREITKD